MSAPTQRWLATGEAARAAGVTTARLHAMRRAGWLHPVGCTQGEYDRLRAAAGWKPEERGWGAGLRWPLVELERVFPDVAVPEPTDLLTQTERELAERIGRQIGKGR